MKTKLSDIVACGIVVALVILGFTSAKADTTFNFDVSAGSFTATGTITTDGFTGVFPDSFCCNPAHFLDWKITVSNGSASADMLGPLSGNNSFIGGVFGGALSANPTHLFWDYNASNVLFNI